MKNPAGKINLRINKGLFKKGDRVLAALSGGADSVCLTHALATLRGELGIEVMAAHFSHGIRPEAAEGERELVKSLCGSLNIPIFFGSADVPDYCKTHGMGLEEGARELRYDFLRRVKAEQGCRLIATAHNLGDNAETVLFNLTRGSGLGGLRGIPEVNGDIVRPLLGVSRGEIEAYNALFGLEYATDKTNFDEKYSRNRLRLSVLPRLREINPAADNAIASAGLRLGQADDYMTREAKRLLGGDRKKGYAPLELVRGSHPALRYYIYARLAGEAGADRLDLSSTHVAAIDDLAEKGRVSAGVDLYGGLRAEITYEGLRFYYPESRSLDGELTLEPGKRVTWNGWRVTAGGERGIAFPLEEIEWPIRVRSRREGDKISLKGGTKSLKKYFIEKKVPREQRDGLPVVCDGRGVLLVGGLAKDAKRCYKDKGTIFKIECGRLDGDEE